MDHVGTPAQEVKEKKSNEQLQISKNGSSLAAEDKMAAQSCWREVACQVLQSIRAGVVAGMEQSIGHHLL